MTETYVLPGRQSRQNVIIQHGEPKGYQQLTVSSSAVGLTVPAGANVAIINVQDAEIRWRDDGTSPTATVGMLVYAANTVQLNSQTSLDQFEAIRASNTDAKLNISYYARN